MSENSEHSADDTEETKAVEDLPNDSSKSETKLMMNQTGAALLEDEEMPTYISVSSISRRDDNSDIINAKPKNSSMEEERSPSPYPSDDQAPSSVYVLSSGEETDQLPYNDEDDEDEYGDSDDMENLELDNDLDPEHPNHVKHLMDEEDDDDDEEDDEDDEESLRRMQNNDDEDVDKYYDRASADFVLNKRLKKRDKEKSSSLQDLSVYKNNTYTGRNERRQPNIVRHNYLNIPQNTVMFSMVHRKQLIPEKYHHIQSKVKLYIKDIKEQNRRSVERYIKDHENTMHSKSNTDYGNNDTKPTLTNRTIKDYAEKTIKELEIAETCDKNKLNCTPLILNGQDNKNGSELMQKENTSTQIETQLKKPFESIQNKKDTVNSGDKMEQKQNGAVEITFPKRETQQFGDTMQTSLIQNGHQERLFNLRTLSYEEYMHGTSGSRTDLNQNAHIIEQEQTQLETYNNLEPMDISEIDNNDTSYPLKIENIKSIKAMTDEVKSNNEQLTFEKINKEMRSDVNKVTSDTLEVISLRDQLNQKTVQYNNLREMYEKQLAENLKIKQELEKLRKSLAKYEMESKPLEQKVASIQTDFIATTAANENHNQTESIHIKQSNNKILSNSAASTLSSIEQWTDSACNLSISMKPPEVTKVLHSDDSMVLTDGTPKKNTRSLSRAFITSSRILQTLSNITQGKTKSESPLVQNSKRRLNENTASSTELQNDDDSYQNRPSSSKRRKITDILGSPNFLQSFKASQNVTELQLKLNEMPNAQCQFKSDTVNEKLESQENSSNINTSQLENATSIESKAKSIDDLEDNVKCFIYRENENSKDRSFLILAEEPAKDKVVNEKCRIRECGPFLLGNVEVRMSEINGTINIWGKEINDESITEHENEMETSTKIKNEKRCYCWQKTPHTRFNGSNIVCSSSKKSKIPPKLELSSAASNISCPHSTSFNTPKPSHSTDKTHAANLCSPYVCISSCENCDSSKHCKEWLRYKRIHPQEKLHSCCTHNIEHIEQKCDCSLHKEKRKLEDNYNCSKEKLSFKEHQRNFSRSPESNKHLHENMANPSTEENEFTCKHHAACNHSLHNLEENCPKNHKCCSTSREASTCEQLTINLDRECNESCNRHSPNIDDEEPLIALKQFNETPETRRRRLSGKRVRGILMDLLRGCGDCCNSNSPNSGKNCSHKKEVPYLTNCSPQIKISPCASPEPSCSNPGQSGGRCCHIYAQRIESQLEEFREEMKKVRSRSDAILDMLNMFQSIDTV